MSQLDPSLTERNYSKKALTRSELEKVLKVVPVTELLNTRHKTAKENDWKTQAPSKVAFLKAALSENNLLRRPVTIRGDRYAVGKAEGSIRAIFA